MYLVYGERKPFAHMILSSHELNHGRVVHGLVGLRFAGTTSESHHHQWPLENSPPPHSLSTPRRWQSTRAQPTPPTGTTNTQVRWLLDINQIIRRYFGVFRKTEPNICILDCQPQPVFNLEMCALRGSIIILGLVWLGWLAGGWKCYRPLPMSQCQHINRNLWDLSLAFWDPGL